MHRKARVSAQLRSVQQNQDWVVSREQALAYGLTRGRMPLPWHKGSRHRRGRRPGGDSLGSTARSHRFVKMRRTVRPFAVVCTDRLRYLAAPDAVIAACRLMTQDRSVVAALSDAVQRRIVTPSELLVAHAVGPPRRSTRTGRAFEHVADGIRSAPEADARLILEASEVLPTPVHNCLLRLPTGRLISPDALIVDAGLVHAGKARRHDCGRFDRSARRRDRSAIALSARRKERLAHKW